MIRVGRQSHIDEEKLAKDFEQYRQYRVVRGEKDKQTSLEGSQRPEIPQQSVSTTQPQPSIVVIPPDPTDHDKMQVDSAQVTTIHLTPSVWEDFVRFAQDRQPFLDQPDCTRRVST